MVNARCMVNARFDSLDVAVTSQQVAAEVLDCQQIYLTVFSKYKQSKFVY